VAGQGVPQTWYRSTESSVSHGPKLGSWKVEEILMSRVCVPDLGLLGEEFLKVWWGISVNAMVSDEGNFVIDSCSGQAHFWTGAQNHKACA